MKKIMLSATLMLAILLSLGGCFSQVPGMTGTEDMIEEEAMAMTGADTTIARTEDTIMTEMATARSIAVLAAKVGLKILDSCQVKGRDPDRNSWIAGGTGATIAGVVLQPIYPQDA